MRRIALSAAVGLGVVLPVATASAQSISEVRIAQPGVDVDQYIEITGEPGTSLDGLQLLVIGDLEGVFPPQQNGGVETIVNLQGTIPASGAFLVANSTYTLGTPDQVANLVFEQGDNLTIILASEFAGSIGGDIDANDDGVIDPKSGLVILDSVAILADAAPDGFSSDFFYSDNTVGPIAGFPPLHSWRCSDTLAWRPGQDALGGDNETPGEINATCDNGGGGGLDGVYLSELRFDHTGADNDEFVEIGAEPGASLDGLAYVVLGDGAGGSGVIEYAAVLDGYTANSNGFFVIAKSVFTLGPVDLIDDGLAHENSDTVTCFLVTDFTGTVGDDLDLDDDGILDLTPWTEVLDDVALIETCDVPPTTTEWAYSANTVGPDGIYVPGGIYRCMPSGEWIIGDFVNYAGEHTPGEENLACEGGGCGGVDRSCFVAHAGPGCSDTVICGLVCDVDPGCCSTEWDSNCAAIAGAYLVAGDAPAVNLSEIRSKQPGTDSDEYIEIAGDPGESLDGLSVLFIGSDGCRPNGVVVHQFNLFGQTIPASGYFVMGDPTLSLGTGTPDYPIDIEIIDAGNLTCVLAWNFTGAKGQLLDTDGDCTLDETPWDALAGDVVAIAGDSSGNCVYLGAIEVGPDDIYTPGHIYKCASGDWDWSAFDTALAVDSPGLANPECGVPPTICGDPANGSCFEVGVAGCDDQACCDRVTTLDPFCGSDSWDETCVSLAIDQCMAHAAAPAVAISEIRIDQPSSDFDEYIELRGDAGASLDGVSLIVVGDGAGGSGTIETILPFGGVSTDAEGIALVGHDTLTLGTTAYPARFNFENSDNVTFLLVFGFSGEAAQDLDTDDDGVLDVTPWTTLLDSISLVETTDPVNPGDDLYYGAVTVGPEETVDGLFFVPGQVWQCADSGEWNIGVFDPASVDPAPTDTPGVVNPDCGTESCEGDFNGDDVVNGADFGSLLAAWGVCSGCPEDLNGDGVVSGADVGLLLSVWGSCP